MDLKFNGKVVLITGAGSQVGFGRQTALMMAKEGCKSIAVSDVIDDVEKTAAELKKMGVDVLSVKADITSKTEVKNLVDKVIAKYGKIDILLNVAGAILHKDNTPIEVQSEEMWAKQINLNLFGTMMVTQAVLPYMKQKKYGVIVNIGSGSTHQYSMGVGMYAISKAAIDTFTKQLAFTEGPNGIRVNCVAPGPAATNFGKILKEGRAAMSEEEMKKHHEEFMKNFPLRRIGTAEDIANATMFLASDASSYVTGQIFHISGGSVM